MNLENCIKREHFEHLPSTQEYAKEKRREGASLLVTAERQSGGGISGDAVFRISAFITDKMASGSKLSVDFLPELSEKEIYDTLRKKAKSFPDLPVGELLFGIVNNQVGRAVLKRADGNIQKAAALIKNFPLTVTGSLGFDYAQVTKGGIPLAETDENLQSRFAQGLYFAGEIVDVDGPCGGFNLQWAFSSACAVAEALQKNV